MSADPQVTAAIVKQCPLCARQYSMAGLLDDLAVQVIGMMLIDGTQESFFFFNHNCPGCGTSFAVPIAEFATLLPEELPGRLRHGSPDCEGHCVRLADLSTCASDCSNAPYRRFLVEVLLDAKGRHEAVVRLGRR